MTRKYIIYLSVFLNFNTKRIINIERIFQTARYMNTYKLDSDNPLNPEKVVKILKSTLMEAMENYTYDKDKCL